MANFRTGEGVSQVNYFQNVREPRPGTIRGEGNPAFETYIEWIEDLVKKYDEQVNFSAEVRRRDQEATPAGQPVITYSYLSDIPTLRREIEKIQKIIDDEVKKVKTQDGQTQDREQVLQRTYETATSSQSGLDDTTQFYLRQLKYPSDRMYEGIIDGWETLKRAAQTRIDTLTQQAIARTSTTSAPPSPSGTPAPTTTTTPTPGSTTTGTTVPTSPAPTPSPGSTTTTPPVATSTEVRQEDLSARNDSDQCKISRLYEPLEMLYFSSRFRSMRSQAYAAAAPQAQINPLQDQINFGKYFITSLYDQPGILKFDLRWNANLLNVNAGRPEPAKFIGINDNDQVNGKDLEFIHKNPKLTSVHSCNTLDQMHCFYLKNEVNNFFVPELIFMKAYRERISDNPRKFGGVSKAIHIQFPLAFEDFSLTTEQQTNDVDNKIRTRINQVGVKSFRWSYQGTDTFTADRDISATLVIEAESLDAIFKERTNSTGEKYRISDLILQSDCFEKKVKTGNQSPETDQSTNVSPDNFYLFGPEGRTIYDPECYEIIVNCGNHIEENILDSLIKVGGYNGESYGNTLSGFHLGSSYTERRQFNGIHSGEGYNLEEIKPDSFKQTLALTVVDHTFDFNDTGGVTLTVEYRARIEGALRKSDADITLKSNASFASTEQTKELNKKVLEALGGGNETDGQALFEEIDSFAESQNVKSGAAYQPQGLISTYYFGNSSLDIQRVGDFARITDAYSHELSSRDDYNSEKGNQEKVSKLNSALAVLRKDSIYSFFQQVYTSLFVNNCITTLKVGSKEMSEYLIRPTIKNLKKIIDVLNREFSSGAPNLEQWIDLSLTNVPTNLQAATQAPGTAPSTQTQGPAQAKRINFVFFGDLLDHIFLVSGYQKTNANLRVVLGNIHLPYTNANLSTNPEDLFPFSLASIPISLTTLNSFFTTIADGSKEKYPISALLRDLVNIVLSSATDSNCMNQLKFPSYRTKMINFSDVNPENWFGYANAERLRTDLLPVQSQRYIHIDDLVEATSQQMNLDHTDFILITCEAPSYREISDGDIVKDFFNKIPHCRLGHLDGIFTKLKLSKTDQPFLKEARFRDSKGNSLMQLSNVYDGYFEMVGNNLLMLGSLIYYDPTTYGPSYMGNPQTPGSLAYFMGLGGLHLVTELIHDINGNKYTTTAKARFVSRGSLKKPR